MTLSLWISETSPSIVSPNSTPLISVIAGLKFDTACRTLATMFAVPGFVLMIRTLRTLPMGRASDSLPDVVSLSLDQLSLFHNEELAYLASRMGTNALRPL